MTDPENPDRSFEVGYGKPPKNTQFVKGKSGNPKGRGKGVRNFPTEIQAELNTRVPVTENGTRKKITKRKAVAKRLVNNAVTGDPKAIPVLLNEVRQHETGPGVGPGSEVLCRPEDHLVMANIVKRIRETALPEPETTPTADNGSNDVPAPEIGGAS